MCLFFLHYSYDEHETDDLAQITTHSGVNQRGLRTSAAGGRRSECEIGNKKEICEFEERSKPTILLTGPLIQVGQGGAYKTLEFS